MTERLRHHPLCLGLGDPLAILGALDGFRAGQAGFDAIRAARFTRVAADRERSP